MAARHGRGGGRGRWRDRRQTIPARRRRRRSHRRDTPRGGDYSPVLVESNTARRGVKLRLFAAVGSLLLTLICLVGSLVGGMSTMGLIAAFSIGFTAFNAGVAFLLSARREEDLHMLANDVAPGPAGLLTSGVDGDISKDGTDGSI